MTSYTPDEALYLPLILRGLSIGFLLPTAASFTFQAVSSVSHVHTAEARGLYYMSRQIGGAIGVAVIAAMLDLRETLHSTQLAEHLAPTNPTVSRALTALGTGPVRHGINPVGVTRAGQAARSALTGARRCARRGMARKARSTARIPAKISGSRTSFFTCQ